MKKAIRQVWKRKSQMLVWILIVSLIVPILPPPRAEAAGETIQPTSVTANAGFRDVSPTQWYYDAVVKVQEKGIFGGTNEGLFSPQGTMTRAMYVTALGRMAGVDVSGFTGSSFADVPAGSWYSPYVEWAVAQRITDGTGGGSFSPNMTVNREQMAAMTLRYFESYRIPYQTGNPVTTKPGDLAAISPWAVDAVVKLWQAGVFTGDRQGNFNPRVQASRAEAAVLFARSSEVVEVWQGQNPSATTPTTPTAPSATPTTGGNSSHAGEGNNSSGSTGGGGSGSNPGTGAPSYTLTFESNGGSAIAAQTVRPNQMLTNLPAPTKDGYIFQGWFADRDLTLIFADGSKLSGNATLYAKYTESLDNTVQSVPSYSVLDVSSNFSIQVEDQTGSLTAAQVKAGMTFVDTADPKFVGVTVTGEAGSFTVASAAEDGKFVEGHTYQLRLANDNLTFKGQDATTDIYVFSVAKQEVLNVPLNPNMIYLHFSEVTNMKLDGEKLGAPSIPVMTTMVSGSGNSLAEANAASGTFGYEGDTPIKVGDTVAIYTGIRPDQRTVATDGLEDGEIAYVQITAVDDDTYSYGRAEADQVVFKPDVLPVSMEADTDGDPANHSITVEHVAMNYSDSQYEALGLDELTTVDVGDFIGFYEGGFAKEDFKSVGYGRITSITPSAEMDIITYADATLEDVTSAFDIYQKQAIDGDQLLTEEQIEQLETQIEQQARKSGFADQAGDYLSDIAMEMPDFKAQTFLAGEDKSRVRVENLTVVAKLGTTLKNIKGRTSGVSATLQVSADIVVELNDDSNMVIHMTGTFVEEISLDLDINSDTSWHWYTISTFLGDIPIFPVIDDYVITANLDTYSYTGMNMKAEIGLVDSGKLEDVLENWVDAQTSGKLKQVKNIANEIKAVLEGVKDTDVGAEALKKQYQEMLKKDTEWVSLIKQTLVEKSVRVALGIIEVKFEAEFVVNAQVNLTIGADFYYKMAKRHSVTVRVLSFNGSSDTVSLPSDGDYQFVFYVMGTIGLRAGIHMEVKVGVGSVKVNSIGIAVEPGVYINLWGYFYYQLKNISGVKTTKSLGALFVEIGIYLEAELGAQLGDGALSGAIELASEEWPLYTIGEQSNVYDFAYPQDKSLILNLAGSASSLAIPEAWLTMKTLDLKKGSEEAKLYDRSRFDIQVDNPNFKYNAAEGKVEIVDKNIQVSEGNLSITWKGAPLSFTSDPIKRTIPMHWLARTGDYILQLNPQNGGVTEIIAAPYKGAIKSVSPPVYPGYTFDGWYTAATGGTKVAIPSQMPAEDRTLYGHWTANTDTPYTVQHYLLDPNNRTLTQPAYTQKLKGTTDTEIRIDSDRYKDQGYGNGKASGMTIKGDGSTVVRVEYYPENRTMTFAGGYAGAPKVSLTDASGKNIAGRIPVPTRQGYTFAGWSPEVPSTVPPSDTTYTATWTGKEGTPYQVVYLLQNIGSDTYTVADTETYRGATDAEATLKEETPRVYAGFTFDEDIPGTVLKSRIASNGKTALKLYYKRDAHTLTIDYNGSGQANKTVEVPVGATTQIYLGTPIRQGHAFAGWLPTPPTLMPEEDVAVTAQWTTNTYTVSFNNNGGAAETEIQHIAYGEAASAPIEPTKEGYVFGGWYSESDPTIAYDFAAPVTGDLTLYARWLLRYTVSFESNEGSVVDVQKVNEGDKAKTPAAPVREGYVFGGWYSDSELTMPYDFTVSPVTADLTLYAKWAVYVPNTYKVTFESNGGSTVELQTVSEGAVASAPAAPTKEGYTFEGWYSDATLTNRYGFTSGITEDLTLYANWIRNSYTVSFNSNQGSAVPNQPVIEGDTASQPTAPTRAGYRFDGWYSDASLQTAYSFTTAVMANVTLYAKWKALYTVNFNSNGGSAVDNQTVEYGAAAARPNDPTKEGYTFNGWYSDAGLKEAYAFAASVTRPLTLYAKWTFNSHIVEFDSNGGSAVQSQVVAPGGKATAPAAIKWAGYRFEGWYSDPDLEVVYDFSTTLTGDITLYAKWTMTSWVPVGEGLAAAAQSNVLFDSQRTPYVAYIKSTYEVFVAKYKDGRWQTVGDSAALGTAGSLDYTSIALGMDSKDVPYVAFKNSLGKADVKKYVDSKWKNIELLTDLESWDGSKIVRVDNSFAITFDKDDNPFLMFKALAEGGVRQPAELMSWSYIKYNNKYDNGYWNAEASIEAFRNSKAFLELLPNDKIALFIGLYSGGSNYAFGESLSKDAVTKEAHWSTIASSAFNNRMGNNLDVAFALDPSGVPYTIYLSGSNVVTMKKYPYLESVEKKDWELVSTPAFSIGSSEQGSLDIAFDSQGIPYVAYRDAANGNRVTVMKYENMDWRPVGYAGFSDNAALELDLAIDSADHIYVSYKEQGKLNIMKFDPNFK